MLRWALAIGRTRAELERSVTSAEVAEMLAFERLEPFGSLHDEQMHGQVCATVANVQRDSKRKRTPFVASDFMASLRRALGDTEIVLTDKKAMSTLILDRVFGGRRKGG